MTVVVMSRFALHLFEENEKEFVMPSDHAPRVRDTTRSLAKLGKPVPFKETAIGELLSELSQVGLPEDLASQVSSSITNRRKIGRDDLKALRNSQLVRDGLMAQLDHYNDSVQNGHLVAH